jgi:hypothetical protein
MKKLATVSAFLLVILFTTGMASAGVYFGFSFPPVVIGSPAVAAPYPVNYPYYHGPYHYGYNGYGPGYYGPGYLVTGYGCRVTGKGYGPVMAGSGSGTEATGRTVRRLWVYSSCRVPL